MTIKGMLCLDYLTFVLRGMFERYVLLFVEVITIRIPTYSCNVCFFVAAPAEIWHDFEI